MQKEAVYKNIEAERGRLGLSKTTLANKIGVTTKTYNSYISGKTIPSTVLLGLSKITGCSIDYLLETETSELIVS